MSNFFSKDDLIFVAGHTGLVGSATVRYLTEQGYNNIITKDKTELDLRQQLQVEDFFSSHKIKHVFLCAAKVGGILYNNSCQAEFLYDNLMIASNVINSAAKNKVEKLIYLGSSCIYPKLASQPISEDSLLTGHLEPTNEGYAIAKIAGLKLCEKYKKQYGHNFVSVMPTNLFGVGDNFHPDNSHVIPGMMRRFHHAKMNNLETVTVWGSGQAKREFLYVDDLAKALFVIWNNYNDHTPINVGTGKDCSIADLAYQMKIATDFKGEIVFDTSKPDGSPRKLLNVDKIFNLDWRPTLDLKQGLSITYNWAVKNNKLG